MVFHFQNNKKAYLLLQFDKIFRLGVRITNVFRWRAHSSIKQTNKQTNQNIKAINNWRLTFFSFTLSALWPHFIVYSRSYTYSCVLFKSEGDAYPPPLSSGGSDEWGLLNKQTNKQTSPYCHCLPARYRRILYKMRSSDKNA